MSRTPAAVLWRFTYFSLTTQTTTGYGDVIATSWVSQIAVMVQMLTAVLYSVVILGMVNKVE